MIKKTIMILTLSFIFNSCGNKEQKAKPKEKITLENIKTDSSIEDNEKESEIEENSNELGIVYPKTGNTAIDFLPKLDIYKIQYEAKGDLNKDGLNDIVVVLVHKKVKTEERPMLILLQKNDKSYRLDKISRVVFPIEYNEYDFKLYDTEDINIENGELFINLYSIGPSGNISGSFKYIEKDLVLTKKEAFYRGAGGSSEVVYDFSKNELTITETNTMDENMPPKSKTIKIKNKKHLFENTSITTVFNEDI